MRAAASLFIRNDSLRPLPKFKATRSLVALTLIIRAGDSERQRACKEFPKPAPKIKATKGGLNFWSGRRESNPRLNLGKVPFYH